MPAASSTAGRASRRNDVPRRSTPPQSAVIGVVVAIPEPWSQLLVDWRSKVGDPQASLVPPHVTLLPPTEVAVADRPAISEHLALENDTVRVTLLTLPPGAASGRHSGLEPELGMVIEGELTSHVEPVR